MGRRNRGGGNPRKKQRGGGQGNRADRQALQDRHIADSMAQVHALFIKMDEQFKGRTIAGVALDANTGAVCIHVEEHNKVLMFHGVRDFAIAEHAGKLRDMLLAAGFIVPDAIMETWNQDFTDMATAYAKAVMSEQDADPEVVDAARIKLILGPYYNPEEAHEELAKLTGQNAKDVAENAAYEESQAAFKEDQKAADAEHPMPSSKVKSYVSLSSELAEMPESHADRAPLEAEVKRAWEALSDAERESLKPTEPAEA